MKLLVYTPTITPRIEYIFNILLDRILGIEYGHTTAMDSFESYSGAKINYSNTTSSNCLQIVPHYIVYQNNVTEKYSFKTELWKGLPIFARTSNSANIQFDIFAAAFFLVSRYEEYGCNCDIHGRFNHSSSIAATTGFLHLPIVDLWAFELLKILNEQWPSLNCRKRQFDHLFTFDLDSSFAIRNKGLRGLTSTAISLIKLNIGDFITRTKVHLNVCKDPFDLLDELFAEFSDSRTVKWFIHVGQYSKYDKPPRAQKKEVKNVIKRISNRYSIGLHPSYLSFNNLKKMSSERKTLENIACKSINASRFHYLRFSLPKSYIQLLDIGITSDYSMGYSNTFGFRAGTCTPFKFFNLEENNATELMVYPFFCMDSIISKHSVDEQKQLIEQMKEAINHVANVNGTFISIWHIDYLSGYKFKNNLWSALREVKEYINTIENGN